MLSGPIGSSHASVGFRRGDGRDTRHGARIHGSRKIQESYRLPSVAGAEALGSGRTPADVLRRAMNKTPERWRRMSNQGTPDVFFTKEDNEVFVKRSIKKELGDIFLGCGYE